MLPRLPPRSTAPASTSPTILIVDDSTRYRTQMRRMVGKSCPWTLVHEAATIQSALRLVAHLQPPLVFVDVVLGEESGIDCARQIKALAPGTQVVLISAYPDPEFHRAGLHVGASAFLDKKDLNAAALYAVITDLLGGDPLP